MSWSAKPTTMPATPRPVIIDDTFTPFTCKIVTAANIIITYLTASNINLALFSFLPVTLLFSRYFDAYLFKTMHAAKANAAIKILAQKSADFKYAFNDSINVSPHILFLFYIII